MYYYLYLHTREHPEGIMVEGLRFNTPLEAQTYAVRHSLAWRWNGFCTIKKGE